MRAAAYTPVQAFQTKQPVVSCFQPEAGVTVFARAPVPVAVARTSSRPAVGPSFQSALMASVVFWQSGWDDGEGQVRSGPPARMGPAGEPSDAGLRRPRAGPRGPPGWRAPGGW